MRSVLTVLCVEAIAVVSAGAQTPDVPVRVSGQTLFVIQAPAGGFTPEERARSIEDRIRKVAADPGTVGQPLSLVEVDGVTEIRLGATIMMAITAADSRAAGRPAQDLAQEYGPKIEAAVNSRRGTNPGRALGASLVLAGLSTCVLIAFLWLLHFILTRAVATVEKWRGTRIRDVTIQRLQLLSANNVADLVNGATKAIVAAAALFVLYVYLVAVLSFFPRSQWVASALGDYVLQAFTSVGIGIVSQFPNLVFIAVVGVITFYVVKFLRLIFEGTERGIIMLPGFYREWSQPTYKIGRFIVLAIAATIVFPYIPGFKSPAFQAMSIFLGILLSLGSTGAVGNIIAGVFLTYTRAFQVGDYVRIGDAEGDLAERTLLVTRVRTIKNEEITIPNSIVLGSHVLNFGRSGQQREVAVYTSVTIGYDTPWRTVHSLLLAAAQATHEILENPAPFVLQRSLNDFYVSYELNAFTSMANRRPFILAELNGNIQDKFNEAGVQIMSPHYTAIRDGNTIAIPQQYVPRDYSTPGFRLLQVNNAETRQGV